MLDKKNQERINKDVATGRLHFVLKNHHVVDAVGQTCEQGQLQHEQQSGGVHAVDVSVGRQGRRTHRNYNPRQDVETDRLEFTLCHACHCHRSIPVNE